MANGGIDDIFIAYPLIGPGKITRATGLAKKIKRLILAVDSFEGASALSAEAQAKNIEFEIRLEVNTGAKRTGVHPESGVVLAEKINELPGLRLTGLFTFKGMIHDERPTTDSKQAALEECTMLAEMAKNLKSRGIQIRDLSAGATPTSAACAELAGKGLVTEIRPGTYVFNDMMCLLQKACEPADIAARILATVVSTPFPEYAVIDGGSKTFPTDTALNTPPFYVHSFAYVSGKENLRLDRVNEEHGMLRSESGGPTGLKIGDVLELIPSHICTAVNLQNYVYVKESGSYRKMPVDARGMLV